MANLIITVIAIALVVVASLMGAYYGGSAFLNNQAAAAASTLVNQGQQLAGAWQAFLSDNLNVAPASLTILATDNYLASVPIPPVVQGYTTNNNWAVYNSGTNYYAVTSVGATGAGNSSGCQRIQHAATGASTETAPPKASALTGALGTGLISAGNGTFGCAQMTAGLGTAYAGTAPAAGDYVMFYKLQ